MEVEWSRCCPSTLSRDSCRATLLPAELDCSPGETHVSFFCRRLTTALGVSRPPPSEPSLADPFFLHLSHLLSYESFLGIVTTMIEQYAKFLKMARETKWRGDVASLNYIETSTLWRQEHNGFR